MLDLILAIICSALVSVIMRVGSDGAQPRKPLLAFNYLACFVVSLFFAKKGVGYDGMETAAGLGLVGGFLYLGAFLLFQRSVHDNGLALSSAFMKLGVVVPTVLGFTLFREPVGPARMSGLLLTVVAIAVLSGRPDARRLKHGGVGTLLLLMVGGGMADGLSKFYKAYGTPALEGHFLCFVFGFALLLCAGLCLFTRQKPTPRDALFGLLLGIPNYFSSWFLLRALGGVPASVAYPVFSCGTILLASACGRIFFSEKIGKGQYAALALVLTALVLLNA